MKRYQVRRWDQRNTLRARKYAVPFLFLMWLTVFGMVYSMTLERKPKIFNRVGITDILNKMNKDLFNSTVTFGKCQMRSSDQLHLNNITFDAKTVSNYASYIENEMDEILFNQKDDSELMQLIQMHKVTLLSLVKMN